MKLIMIAILLLTVGLPLTVSYALQPTTITVSAGGNLQAALNSAKCNDIILLEPATYKAQGESGFIFADKGCGANGPTVKTNSTLPSGRVQIGDGAAMAKLVPDNTSLTTYAVITFPANSSGWNVTGIEITTIPGQPYCPILVSIGPYVTWSQAPNNLTFDRMYIHSLEDGTHNPHATSRIGASIFGRNINFSRSRLSMPGGYVGSSQVVDNQYAWLSESGPGPITFENCFTSAWYNSFMLGGASMPTDNKATVQPGATLTQAILSNVKNLKVGDLMSFQQSDSYYGSVRVTAINGNMVNYVAVSTSWGAEGSPLTLPPLSPGDVQWNGYLPTNVSVLHSTIHIDPEIANQIEHETGAYPKGYFEIKSVDGFLVEGCDFTGRQSNWAFTVRNQGTPHGSPSVWSTIKNVTIRSNRYLGANPSTYRMIVLSLEDNYATSTPGGNILLENNLIVNAGKLADVSAGDGITFRNNTLIDNFGSSLIENLGVISKNLVLNNNVMANNEYGTHCQTGNYSCFPKLFEGNMLGNILVGPVLPYRPTCGNPYPTGNLCVNTYNDVRFVDAANENYRIAPTSPAKNKGADGKDPGVDMDKLLAALGGATPQPTPTPIPSVSPSPSPVQPPTDCSSVIPIRVQVICMLNNYGCAKPLGITESGIAAWTSRVQSMGYEAAKAMMIAEASQVCPSSNPTPSPTPSPSPSPSPLPTCTRGWSIFSQSATEIILRCF